MGVVARLLQHHRNQPPHTRSDPQLKLNGRADNVVLGVLNWSRTAINGAPCPASFGLEPCQVYSSNYLWWLSLIRVLHIIAIP